MTLPNARRMMWVPALVLALLACSTGTAPAPQEPVTQPGEIRFENVRFVIPDGLAVTAIAGSIPEMTLEDGWSPWSVAPEHIKFQFEYYSPCCSMHAPVLLVYPAEAFAAISQTNVSDNLAYLRSLAGGAASLDPETLPVLPFFNAVPQVISHAQVVRFHSGTGVRSVTQYSNGQTPITDYGLFYQYQGLSDDGLYYVIAVLPASAPFLPPDDTQLPIDSPTLLDYPVWYKTDLTSQDFLAYYQAVTDELSATAPGDFEPALSVLDELIGSLTIDGERP